MAPAKARMMALCCALFVWSVIGMISWLFSTYPPVPPLKAVLLFLLGGPAVWVVVIGGLLVTGVIIIFCWVRGNEY